MPVKMRLQRRGKKGKPFFHIVIADGRAPRDGKFIEKIGSYNPVTKPATIEICADKAVAWLRNGAQPSDTVKAILSYKGILYKFHLLKGVDKGALTLEQAEVKFEAWKEQKEAKINSAINNNVEKATVAEKERFAKEVKINETRAAAIAKKNQVIVAAPVVEAAPEVETEAVAAPEVEATPEVKANHKAEANHEVKAEPEVKANHKAEANHEVKAEPEVKVAPEAKAETEAAPEVKATEEPAKE